MHPVLFDIPRLGFELRSYGVMIAIAFLAATLTAAARSARAGVNRESIYDVAVFVVIAAVVGARLLYVAENWHELEHWWEAFLVWRGGLVFYGGVILAALAAIIFSAIKKMPLLALLDVIAPSVALGLFFGRIGCFLNGCCFGKPTSLPWGVVFPERAFVYLNSVYLKSSGEPVTFPTRVHPTQLYEAAFALGLYVLLEWFFRKKRSYNGQIALLFGFIYPIGRFTIEFFRGDNRPVLFGMTVSQVLSALYFLFTIILYIAIRPHLRRAGH